MRLPAVASVLPVLAALALPACESGKGDAKSPPSITAAGVAHADEAPPAKAGGDPAAAAAPRKDDKAQKPPAADVPGLDLSGLDPSQVDAMNRFLDEKPSACGKSHSLRTSLKTDAGCKRSTFAARYLVRLLKAGLLPSEAEEIYDKRFTAPEMGNCEISEGQVRGNAHAPITLCEFSDFQCPHCKLMEPVLSRVLEDYGNQVRLIYKNYPISKLHPEAAAAAAAAVAAGKQGKFWPMHDKLFANQEHLTAVDLEGYAKELKLDLPKWKADLASARDAVEKDHAEGEKLDIQGTPTVYINGRKYAGPLRYEELKDWIDEELSK